MCNTIRPQGNAPTNQKLKVDLSTGPRLIIYHKPQIITTHKGRRKQIYFGSCRHAQRLGRSICSALYEHEIQRSTNNADSEDEEAPEDGEAVPGGVDPQRQASPTTAQLISKGRNGE